MSTQYQKLSSLLKKLFQNDQAELDFGMYRVINQRRDEINQFLENGLLPQVKTAFAEYQSVDKQNLNADLEEAIKQVKDAEMDPDQSPKVKRIREQITTYSVDIDDLENQVYSALFNFFRRYYDKGDFISQRRYKEGVYAIPYEGEEVKLHWANHDQYYIKTSEYLRDYTFKLPSGKLTHFKLVEADTEKDNRKETNDKKRRFILAEEPLAIENSELAIRFEFRPDDEKRAQKKLNEQAVETILSLREHVGEQTLKDALAELATLSPTEKNKKRTLLAKHLGDYTRRNTQDYFIHKDLGKFLRREMDFFIKNEIMHLDNIENETVPKVKQYLSKIKVIRRVAHKLIDFLAQIEDFQKKLWLKKKFVVETHYCVTLDRVPEELYPAIAKNDAQREEWVKLFAIDEIKGDMFKAAYSEPLAIEFLKINPYLVLDTKLFDEEFKFELLASIESLDEELDGLIIHSENFQALNLIKERYRKQVGCVYIDPPYNTSNKEFLYKDKFKHSSWMAMMSDRYNALSPMLSNKSNIFTQIDYNEANNLLTLLKSIFGEENYVNEIIWRRKQATSYSKKQMGITNDTIFWFSNNSEYIFNPIHTKDDEHTQRYISERFVYTEEETNRKYMKSPLVNSLFRPNLRYVFHGINHPPNGWLYSKERMEEMYQNNELVMPEDPNARIYRKIYEDTYKGQLIQNIWTDIPIVNPMAKERVEGFVTQKPSALIERIVQLGSNHNDIVIDFFAGSGTTAYAIQKLNRKLGRNHKYIMIEMGHQFDTFLKPRVKKFNYPEDIKNSKPISQEGFNHAFKYIKLESYEDTLNNLELRRTDEQAQALLGAETFKEDYLLRYMLDFESKDSLLDLKIFETPFDYKLKIASSTVGETVLTRVDLVETFNYLIGLQVRTIRKSEGVVLVEGRTHDNKNVLVIWRSINELDNEGLNAFFTKHFAERQKNFDTIYVNCDNTLENIRPQGATWKVHLTEEEFHYRMFEEG